MSHKRIYRDPNKVLQREDRLWLLGTCLAAVAATVGLLFGGGL